MLFAATWAALNVAAAAPRERAFEGDSFSVTVGDVPPPPSPSGEEEEVTEVPAD